MKTNISLLFSHSSVGSIYWHLAEVVGKQGGEVLEPHGASGAQNGIEISGNKAKAIFIECTPNMQRKRSNEQWIELTFFSLLYRMMKRLAYKSNGMDFRFSLFFSSRRRVHSSVLKTHVNKWFCWEKKQRSNEKHALNRSIPWNLKIFLSFSIGESQSKKSKISTAFILAEFFHFYI